MIFKGLEQDFQCIGICIGEVERPNLKKSNEMSFKEFISRLAVSPTLTATIRQSSFEVLRCLSSKWTRGENFDSNDGQAGLAVLLKSQFLLKGGICIDMLHKKLVDSNNK
jgi:hypothetical protein